jgi:magnesium-transporting ATPase (P-type)
MLRKSRMVKHHDIAGLSDSQVEQARTKYGTNQLPPPEVESFFDKLKENFEDPLIRILLVALGITVGLYVFALAYRSTFFSIHHMAVLGENGICF